MKPTHDPIAEGMDDRYGNWYRCANRSCSAQIDSSHRFCGGCGRKLPEGWQARAEKRLTQRENARARRYIRKTEKWKQAHPDVREG